MKRLAIVQLLLMFHHCPLLSTQIQFTMVEGFVNDPLEFG
jgi:hypothetical protein